MDKYDAVLNDVKFTLSEFIKTGDEEYIQLMSKSLGLEVEGMLDVKENGVVKKWEWRRRRIIFCMIYKISSPNFWYSCNFAL